MDKKDDEKDENKGDNDVISSYFKDIKKIMDLHGRMVSAVDDTVNRLPFGESINYSLATTIAANSTKIGKKHKHKKKSANATKNTKQNLVSNTKNVPTDDEISQLVQKKDEIMESMNKQIASLQKIKDENKRENILKELNTKLSLIDDMNEDILKLKDAQNKHDNETDDEFNDENDISFDDMKIKGDEETESTQQEEKEEDIETDEPFTIHVVGFGMHNKNNYETISIMEKVSGITIETELKSESGIAELRDLIYDTFEVPIINNKKDKNDLLILYSHLVLNDDFLDKQTLGDAGIINNSFFLVVIKDKEEQDLDSIFDITEDDIQLINQMFNIKEKKENNGEMDIGQILQRLKIEKKLSLDIITQEADVEVFKMPNCGHSMTASSLYDYALSQCLNKEKILNCAHFKCNAEWKYPIIKQYLLTNIQDDIIASVMLKKEREEKREEDAIKVNWDIGTMCLIFSRSQDKWLAGKIVEITGENINDEWLIVKYGNDLKKKKKIQRYCKDIKPIPKDHAANFVKGSKCQIFDADSQQKWIDGDVVNIFTDNEGEWLKIKYMDKSKAKVCDIQRYSSDLKLIIIKSEQDIKDEKNKNKKYDVNYISKIKCGKLEILLSRNILFRNEKYSVQKCIHCNVLLYRVKTSNVSKIKFHSKCRMCEGEFCWSCNKEWKSNHSCDASFRFQIIEILSNCVLKTIGTQLNVPSIRSCPSCSALIYHVEACKHMDCGECHQSFCFVCLGTKDDNDEWQCGGYSDQCPSGVYPRQTNKDLPPMTYTKKFQLF